MRSCPISLLPASFTSWQIKTMSAQALVVTIPEAESLRKDVYSVVMEL